MEIIQTSEPDLLPGLGDLSKKQLTQRAKQIINDLHEQGEDVLKITAIAVRAKHFATELEKAGKLAGYENLCQYGPGGVSKEGVKLITKDTGVSYDYSADAIWKSLKVIVDEATARLKNHEELLKRIPNEGMGLTDPETGETYLARRPVKSATQTIEATIL